jgi:hypothetical protein
MDRILAQLHELSPRDFERIVALLLEAQGYSDVRVIGGANDRGVDITCRDSDGSLVAVQCKRYDPSKSVGALAVQHLSAMAFHRRAHRAVLVTTARFTESARRQAAEFDIELIDGQNLVGMVRVQSAISDRIRSMHPVLLGSREGTKPYPANLVHIPFDKVCWEPQKLQAFLATFPPEFPAVLRKDYPPPIPTELQRIDKTLRDFSNSTPEQFRQAVALTENPSLQNGVGQPPHSLNRMLIYFLRDDGSRIQDYVVDTARAKDGTNIRTVVRCHHSTQGSPISAHDIYQFLSLLSFYRTSENPRYYTSGYFSCEAYSYIASLKRGWFRKMLYALYDGPSLARWFFGRSNEGYLALANRAELPDGVVIRKKGRIFRRLFR